MKETETIAAISTAYGNAAVGIVRVSGKSVQNIIKKHIGNILLPRLATNTLIKNNEGKVLDEVIAIFYKTPKSYTGEDMLEIQSHGNPVILNNIMDCLCEKYARLAAPGEFTERAFLNNKIDLLQAEAVMDIINSTNSNAAKSAIKSLQGNFSEKIKNIKSMILDSRSAIEADINFPEDELPNIQFEKHNQSLSAIVVELESAIKLAINGVAINCKTSFAIVGKPNVGKSSLSNLLLGEQGSIVSSRPGTTRDTIRHEINFKKNTVTFYDTAGLRSTDDEIESEGIDLTKKTILKSSIVLYVVDDMHGFDKADKQIIKDNNVNDYWVINNKIDKTNKSPSYITENSIKIFNISVLKNLGVDLLINEITNLNSISDENIGTARQRHVDLLKKILDHLYMAKKYNNNQGLDIAAEELRLAHHATDEILGGQPNEELLDKVFSDFCIGK